MGRRVVQFVVVSLVSVMAGCTSKLVKEGAETTTAPATTVSNESLPSPMPAASPVEPPTNSPIFTSKPTSAIESRECIHRQQHQPPTAIVHDQHTM
ncbi:hypothetical protein HQN90_35975 [Paenibacillus alba]|uniref:hypothetical protein n=1 Tax=Paenibacillus alba TaxID=1197127 RepID=UPI001563E74F|nr:hypothetical protein [Paenibacillus alba]NQX71498.1 hypothetical protein [Paenibacillus alba]